MTITVAIYVFPDVEVLDFAGPYEVFTTASRVYQRRNPGADDLFRVLTVTAEDGLVRARAGLAVQADYRLEAHPAMDVLIIPGGVVDAELVRPEVIRWIAEQTAHTRLTASVCTGAFLLAQAGLLDGRTVTTHWEDMAELRTRYPALTVKEDCRWVDEGEIVTSGGISAGIDMSLHLVARLAGRELAVATARQMEVEWREG
jgi:transcriptional regulator GlxA family with amidase domain